MKTDIEFIPYGEISSRLTEEQWPKTSRYPRISKSWRSARRASRRVFVTLSHDLDESFAEMYRKKATQDTRLLIFDEGVSTDRLIARIVDLQIRSPRRFCIIDASYGSGKPHLMACVRSLLNRLSSAHEADDDQDRLLDVKLRDGVLHVVSPNFNRLDVPIVQISELRSQDPARIQEFEIDEDGAFIYWPKLDLHLGWAQLQQLVNPEAALKASQKSRKFNERYGESVKKVREHAGLKGGDIAGISVKQLRRIERGECRLTSNAIEALSKAHKLAPNQYLKKLVETLD